MGSSADNDGSTTKSTHHVDEEDDDDDTIRSPLTIASINRTHDQMLLYVKPSLTLQLVNVYSMPKFPSRKNIPTQMEKYMDWKVEDEDGSDDDDDGGVELFYPILHNSEFWITMDSMVEVDDTLTKAPTTTTTTSNSENDIQTTQHQPTNYHHQQKYNPRTTSTRHQHVEMAIHVPNGRILATTRRHRR